MKKLANKKIIYYKTYIDDVVESKEQDYKIKDDFKWIHSNIFYRLFSKVIFEIASVFSFVYYGLILNIKIENRDILKKYKKKGYFLYGNHTQPVGDAFMPKRVVKKRFYTIAGEANLGIPFLGKILPALGALVVPTKISKTKEFLAAVDTRIKENKTVIIYPEGHVWPYYTKIRPFPTSAFKFQVDSNVPSFSMTVTYYKRKKRKKPGIRIFVDGPFFPDEKLSIKQREEKLKNEIYSSMIERSKNSDYEYIEYKEKKGET